MVDIFLSYAREDLGTARNVAAALEAEGWSVFWDRRIPAGRNYEDYLEEQINEASVVVVLWSPYSVASQWVRREAAHARDRGRSVLVPILIADASIPFGFADIHAADFRDWRNRDDCRVPQDFLGSLNAISRRSGSTATIQQPRAVVVPSSHSHRRWTAVLVVIAFGVFLAFSIYRSRSSMPAETARESEDRRAQEKREQDEVTLAKRNSDAFAAAEKQASATQVHAFTVSVLNRCETGDVNIAFLYRSISADWVTAGWWTAKFGVELNPSIWPTSDSVYFFANGARFTWEGEVDAPQRYIVSNIFTFKANDAIVGRNKRLVRFRQASKEDDRRIELFCRVN